MRVIRAHTQREKQCNIGSEGPRMDKIPRSQQRHGCRMRVAKKGRTNAVMEVGAGTWFVAQIQAVGAGGWQVWSTSR